MPCNVWDEISYPPSFSGIGNFEEDSPEKAEKLKKRAARFAGTLDNSPKKARSTPIVKIRINNYDQVGTICLIQISNYIPRIRRIGGCYGFTSKPPTMVLTR